jgi:putative transposase
VVAGVLAAFRYRLYPKPQQERLLKSHLSALCQLYNELRDLRINAWREKHASLSDDELRQAALDMRKRNEGLQEIHSQVVQSVATRVYTAFKNYFEGRARFPKHKKERRYRSLTYPQSGFSAFGRVVERGNKTELKGRLYLSKVGHVRIFMHRPLEGRIKNLTVKYDAGEWYAAFICELPDRPKKPVESIPEDRIRGGDLGLINFLTLSDGRSADYPEYLRGSEERIKRLQRVLSRARINSRNFRKLALRLARLHRRVFNQRENYQNQVMAGLYRDSDVIVLEKLCVSNMLKNHCLAKSIQDAAFGKFIDKAMFKADFLGRWFVPVDPWGTTQLCHNCLEWVPKDLSERQHRCPNCGVDLPRDENSALLIKKLGLIWLGYAPGRGVNTPAEQGLLPSLRGWQAWAMKWEAPGFSGERTSHSVSLTSYRINKR